MGIQIAACVIVYRPEQFVEHNIASYIKNVQKIYLIDNTEIKAYDDKFLSAYISKIVFIHDGNNEGIAKRLNYACKVAIQEGFEFLLTMDQDSYFEEKYIDKYLECLENFSEKEKVSMFGINYRKEIKNGDCNCNKADLLITSGSIINLTAYKAIGNFDEKLFIDFVDTDYCFQSILKGYELIEFTNIFMHHNLGEVNGKRSYKNFKKTQRTFHSSVRLYYMTRNFFYLKKKYHNQFIKKLSAHKTDLLNRIKNKLLYNKNRFETVQFLFRALKDYKKNKMGKQF